MTFDDKIVDSVGTAKPRLLEPLEASKARVVSTALPRVWYTLEMNLQWKATWSGFGLWRFSPSFSGHYAGDYQCPRPRSPHFQLQIKPHKYNRCRVLGVRCRKASACQCAA